MNRRRLLELVHTGEYDCWDIVLGNVMQALMAVYINRRLPNSYIMKAATACNKGDYRTAIGLFWNGIIVDLSGMNPLHCTVRAIQLEYPDRGYGLMLTSSQTHREAGSPKRNAAASGYTRPQ